MLNSFWIKNVSAYKGIYEMNQFREFIIYALIEKNRKEAYEIKMRYNL